MQVRRNFIVLGPESLLKDRKRSAIYGLAFVISLEAVEDRCIGDGVEQGSRIVFAKQSSRNLPSFSPRRFGGREISLGMQNAADIVIDDAAGQAVLTVQFDDRIQRLLVQVATPRRSGRKPCRERRDCSSRWLRARTPRRTQWPRSVTLL